MSYITCTKLNTIILFVKVTIKAGYAHARKYLKNRLQISTDDITCCRGYDDPPNGVGRGEWYYPNGTVVPPPDSDNSIYQSSIHMVTRRNRRPGAELLIPGVYTCVIPGAG